MNVPCILIPILVGLFCGILGYLLGKLNSKNDDALVASLQADLDASKAHTKSLTKKIDTLEADLLSKRKTKAPKVIIAEVPPPFDAVTASNVLGKNIKENDLKIVKGIGPKIESLFHEAGILTWRDLSEASTEKLQSILDAGGENYAIHNPSTWAKQSLFAYEGRWQELKDWHESLLGGKE